MKYITINAKTNVEDYLQEFKDAIKDVVEIKLSFDIDGYTYKSSNDISEKTFKNQSTLMEDLLGYGYKGLAFGKHSVSTKSDMDKLFHIDIYKYSFKIQDHPGVRFVVLFQKIQEKNLSKKVNPKYKYKLKTKISALDAYD